LSHLKSRPHPQWHSHRIAWVVCPFFMVFTISHVWVNMGPLLCVFFVAAESGWIIQKMLLHASHQTGPEPSPAFAAEGVLTEPAPRHLGLGVSTEAAAAHSAFGHVLKWLMYRSPV